MILRLATFNIRYGTAPDDENSWNNRRGLALDCIREMAPDVLCVQECLPFQSDEIKMGLPHLDHFGLGRYHGTENPRPHETFSGEHCAIFFDPGRLLLERCGTFWHSETPEIPGSRSWDNKLPRTTTWGVFRSRTEELPLAVFNTHYGFGPECVRRTTDLMLERIPEIAGDVPTIVAGDFNLLPASAEHSSYERLVADVWTTVGKSETGSGTAHGFTGVSDKRIDWIMATAEAVPVSVDVVSWSRDGRYPSDHFPVLAVLQLPSQSREANLTAHSG